MFILFSKELLDLRLIRIEKENLRKISGDILGYQISGVFTLSDKNMEYFPETYPLVGLDQGSQEKFGKRICFELIIGIFRLEGKK